MEVIYLQGIASMYRSAAGGSGGHLHPDVDGRQSVQSASCITSPRQRARSHTCDQAAAAATTSLKCIHSLGRRHRTPRSCNRLCRRRTTTMDHGGARGHADRSAGFDRRRCWSRFHGCAIVLLLQRVGLAYICHQSFFPTAAQSTGKLLFIYIGL